MKNCLCNDNKKSRTDEVNKRGDVSLLMKENSKASLCVALGKSPDDKDGKKQLSLSSMTE